MFDFFKVLADEVAGGTTPTPDAGAGAGANPGDNPWMLIFAVGLIIVLIISTIVQNKKRKTQVADEERRTIANTNKLQHIFRGSFKSIPGNTLGILHQLP